MVTSQVTGAERGIAEYIIVGTDSEIDLDTSIKCVIASPVKVVPCRRNVLGSEKIRLMERKMKNEILGYAYSPAETLQNELCLMKIGQFSPKIKSFEVESQHST